MAGFDPAIFLTSRANFLSGDLGAKFVVSQLFYGLALQYQFERQLVSEQARTAR